MERKYLHLLLNNFSNDTRILKQSHVLSEESGWAVCVFALCDKGQKEKEKTSFGRVRRFNLLSRPLPKQKTFQILKYIEFWIRTYFAALRYKPSLIQANDLSALPIGWTIARKLEVPLIYDTHELETEVSGVKVGSLRQKALKWLEKRLIDKPHAIITVCDSIADWYESTYAIAKPAVVRNAFFNSTAKTEPVNLKKQLDIPESSCLFLYLGGLIPGRGIPLMLQAFSKANNDKHLLFIGYGGLEPLIRRHASNKPNIHILPAVSPEEITSYAMGSDVGMCLIENISLSYYYSLPNKIFEYMSAGIPVCVSNFPEQKKIVEQYNCGWVLEHDEDKLVSFINELTSKNILEKREGVKHAQPSISWEAESKKYLQVVNSLAHRNHCGEMDVS